MKADPQRKAELDRPRLFLRIRHPVLDPRQITDTLAMQPLQTIAAGAVVAGGVRRLHTESYWIAELTAPSLHEQYEQGKQVGVGFGLSKERLLDFNRGTEWDVRILLCLGALESAARQSFLRQVAVEGGSVTLLISRGSDPSPISIRRSLAKLAQFGIDLEID